MEIKDKTVINGVGNNRTKIVERINCKADSLQSSMNQIKRNEKGNSKDTCIGEINVMLRRFF